MFLNPVNCTCPLFTGIRYLTSQGLLFPSASPTEFHAYANANWAGYQNTRRFTNVRLTIIPFLVELRSRIQFENSQLRVNASRCPLPLGSKMLFRGFQWTGISILITYSLPRDNTCAIPVANNTMFHERTKCVEV